MKTFSGKHSKKLDSRQAARPIFAPGEAELFYMWEDGTEIHKLNPVRIPSYTYSF